MRLQEGGCHHFQCFLASFIPPSALLKPCQKTHRMSVVAVESKRQRLLTSQIGLGEPQRYFYFVSGLSSVRQGAEGTDRTGALPTVSWPEHAAMETGDVVVTVEHCHGCHRHRMTTRHDPEVSQQLNSSTRQLRRIIVR